MTPTELERLGLGLQYDTVRHARARPEWQLSAQDLISELREVLGPMATSIEHIGSAAVKEHPDGRGEYTKGKSDIVSRLLPHP